MTITQWHVPVDDHGTITGSTTFTSFHRPARQEDHMREQRLATYPRAGLPPAAQSLQTPGAMIRASRRPPIYLRMGFDINIHDQWVRESQG